MLKTLILSCLFILSSIQCPIETVICVGMDGEPVLGMEAQLKITPYMTTCIPHTMNASLIPGCPEPHLFTGTLPLKPGSEGSGTCL